jgi:hypothetical protein
MNLVNNVRWAVIATSILSGSALAATINCPISPAYSVITEGQTLQLTADCDGALDSIEWSMADGMPATSLTGVVTLSGHSAHKPISFTTPVGLGGSNEFTFTLSGTANGANTFAGSSATVVVKPSSAAIARAQGVSNPTTPLPAACGTKGLGGAATSMPTGTEQCATGSTAALAISGPSSFTWSCISLTGGAEASCFAVRGYTVTASPTSGGTGYVSPGSQGVAAGGTASITASPASGYTATMSGCGGTQSGNSFTTGPVNANCTVTATFTNAPVNGACGSASNSTVVTSAPSSSLCSTGSPTTVASNTNNYTWGCNGANGGSNTSATACSAPRGYMVSTSAGSNGSISAGKVVQGGTTTTFTVTPASGYVASVSGCNGGSLSGTTYNANAITGVCTLTASFTQQSPNTDPGSGSWLQSSNRLIADQSGTSTTIKTTYAPGCLNGDYPPSGSSSGCAGSAADESGFAFGSGSVLGLRYMSKATLGTPKYIRINSGDGGNLGQTMKAWLSTDPTSTYDSTPSTCRYTSTTTLYAVTGTGYCVLQPSTRYYLFMSVDAAGTTFRYKVDELSADLE